MAIEKTDIPRSRYPFPKGGHVRLVMGSLGRALEINARNREKEKQLRESTGEDNQNNDSQQNTTP
ncbi:hypothetical protein ISR94_00745 [Candidatus Microgenomates bacterium]|nr:hypothetical protein [Candidatus Microgenomates bacterium]